MEICHSFPTACNAKSQVKCLFSGLSDSKSKLSLMNFNVCIQFTFGGSGKIFVMLDASIESRTRPGVPVRTSQSQCPWTEEGLERRPVPATSGEQCDTGLNVSVLPI